jgi:SAM-dependent methyltransferase
VAVHLPGPARRAIRWVAERPRVEAALARRPEAAAALVRATAPPVGRVRFGDLRRTRPIARDFGYGRGGPVDRRYIEAFLDANRQDVRGRVLEVGDDTYTRRFGGERVDVADVLHVDPGSGARYVGDLADGSFLPSDAFDCIVLTQTLHLIYDFPRALCTLRRALAPGGALLLTVPGISNLDPWEWGATWYYSFTQHSLDRMLREGFPGFEISTASYGNVLAAVAFLHGLSSHDLTPEELDDHQPEYSLVHAARVRRPPEEP